MDKKTEKAISEAFKQRSSKGGKAVKPENRYFAKNPEAAKAAGLKSWEKRRKKDD